MRHLLTCCVLPVLLLCLAAPGVRAAGEEDPPEARPIDLMLGETLSYDVSFLWFRRLAEGTISLRPGPQPGQYVALLEARTLGLTAFLTRHRIERIETLMELGPEGLLRPLLHQAHTIKGEGESRHERIRSYRYDHSARTVFYRNWKTGQAASERRYPMEKPGPVYDILSAFYNVRAGRFGALTRGRHVAIPTFTRRGTEDVVVARVAEQEQLRQSYFPPQSLLCKVLVNPETFGTSGRDIFVQFDERMVPQRAVVKNVIGLGDVRGILRESRSDIGGDLPPGAPREGDK